MTDHEIIAANFSRHARHYEDYACVQRYCAECLLESFDLPQNPQHIIDLGCGTGILTRMLAARYPEAEIDAVDISDEMLQQARKLSQNFDAKINWIHADVQDFSTAASYDLVISNACLQWLQNLEGVFEKCGKILTAGGKLAFSAFGPETYHQLRRCIAKTLGQPQANIAASNFITAEQTQNLLQKYLSDVQCRQQTLENEYNSLMELLGVIKYTGTRGSGLSGRQLTRRQLRKLQNCYETEFGKITATSQLMFFSATKAR